MSSFVLSLFFNTTYPSIDPIPLEYKVFTVISLIGFVLLYKLSHRLSYTLFQTYKNFDSKPNTKINQANWNSRIVSTFHAVVTVFIWIYVFLMDSNYVNFPVDKIDRVGSYGFIFSCTYFIYDLYLTIKYYPDLGGKGMLLHHIMGILATGMCVAYKNGAVFLLMFYITELSTPFVNNRWLLDAAEMKKERLYLLNGVAMWFTFGSTRIPIIFVTIYIMWNGWSQFVLFPFFEQIVVMSETVLISVLNVYWFSKITSGILKHMGTPKKKKL